MKHQHRLKINNYAGFVPHNLIIALLLLLFSGGATSQTLTDVFKRTSTVQIKSIKRFSNLYKNVKPVIFEDNLYFFYVEKITPKLNLHILNLETHRENNVSIDLKPFKEKIYANIPVKGIAINSNYMIINFSDFVACYKRSGLTKFTFDYVFDTKEQHYTHVEFYNPTTLILGACYNFHPNDSKNNAVLALYDMEKRQMIKSTAPFFQEIGFTHFTPGKWIAKAGTDMFFGNSAIYHVNQFDSCLTQTDTITRDIANWKQTPEYIISSLKHYRMNSSLTMNTLTPYVYDSINRVEEIWEINDSNLMVQYTVPSMQKYLPLRYCDIYKKEGKTWTIHKKDLLNGSYNPQGLQGVDTSQVMSADNWNIMSYNYAHIFGSSYLIVFDKTSTLPLEGLRYADFYRKQKEYYQKNDPIFGIHIFKYKNE